MKEQFLGTSNIYIEGINALLKLDSDGSEYTITSIFFHIYYCFPLSPGGVVLTSSLIGMIGGGLIMRGMNLKIKGLIKFNLLMEILGLPTILCFLLSCDQMPLAGIHEPYLQT